jgi:glycosyltransferase involved in cell wall biosynthesis
MAVGKPGLRMILFISHDASRSGAPIVLAHLLKWIRKNTDMEFEILLKKGGELASEFAAIAPTHIVPEENMARRIMRRLHAGRRMPMAVPAALRGKKYDLIYSNTITNGELVSRLKDRTNTVITHAHEMDSWIERLGEKKWREVVEQTTRFVAVSAPVRDCLIRHGVPDRAIELLPECASVPAGPARPGDGSVRRALGISDGAWVIGGGGGAEVWRKGRDIFVQLAARMIRKNTGHDFQFIWIGSHPDAAATMWLKHDARLSGCENSIHWVGSAANPGAYYSAMDAFAMTSREDPLPLVALEAGMLGVPVVCFNGAGGTADWVKDEAGFTVPYLDIDAMAEKILLLANDRTLLREKGARARDITRSRFAIDQIGKKFADYLVRELKDHARP